MSKKVYVTGLGVISSIGNNVEENYQSLMNKKTGIREMKYLRSKHKSKLPVGEVQYSTEDLLKITGKKVEEGFTRTALLGMIAAKEAFDNAQLSNSDTNRVGLISANTVGGMRHTEQFYKRIFDKDDHGNFLSYVGAHDSGESTERIADYLGIKDYINTINTACSSSANAVMLGARLIKAGVLDTVVVGGTDSLTKFTMNGFNSLMILSELGCKPFSKTRNGLNLGEGAGFIVIEGEEMVEGKKVYSEVTGYSNKCDAFHQTASSPDGEGAYMTMKESIKMAGISVKDVDYINAHGTATEINDASEGTAIMRLFGDQVPKLSSTKSFTGHTLGASGGIEAVYANLSISRSSIFPNLNFEEQIEELNFSPQTEALANVEVKNVLSNAFGFGGNNTTLIFSKSQS